MGADMDKEDKNMDMDRIWRQKGIWAWKPGIDRSMYM
jgi:hypothetical protein